MGGEVIEIRYKTSQVEKVCKDFKFAKKKLNERVATKLHAMINLLENVDNLNEVNMMRIYNLHHLEGKRKGQYALDLGRSLGYRLVLTPLDENGEQYKEDDVNILYSSTKIILVWEVSNHYE